MLHEYCHHYLSIVTTIIEYRHCPHEKIQSQKSKELENRIGAQFPRMGAFSRKSCCNSG